MLDETAAAATAAKIVAILGAPAFLPQWLAIVQAIHDGIKTNAVVTPIGIPPMTTPSGPVAGTGKVQ